MSYTTQGIIGSASVGGEWELVERWVPTSASTGYTFTGLNGDRDRRYKIVFSGIGASSNNYVGIRLNGDNGSNYNMARGENGSYVQLNNDTDIIATYLYIGDIGIGEIDVYTISGQKRQFTVLGGYYENPTYRHRMSYGAWNNTTDNITSITIQGRSSNIIGIGSYAELWRLKQNNQIFSGEWSLVERWEPTVASTSYTFSGLNGDRDRRYKIEFRLLNSSGLGSYIYMQLNGDTADKYVTRYIGVDSGGLNTGMVNSSFLGGNYAIPCGYVANSTNYTTGKCQIDAKTSTYRLCDIDFFRTDSNIALQQFKGYWTDTTSNITSIKISSVSSNIIGVGSYFELWKLGQ